jgi:hypothetical protein
MLERKLQMPSATNRLSGCEREVEDCFRLLKTELNPEDRLAIQRRLAHAQKILREIEDEILLLSLIE